MSGKTWLFCSVNPQAEEKLFDWAVESCSRQNIELKVVVVLPKLSANIFEWFASEQHQDLKKEQRFLEKQRRHAWQKKAEKANVVYSIEVYFGKLFYEVVQLAQHDQVALLVKQAEDIKQSDGVFFQSEDWHLLRKSSAPLLLYRESSALPFDNIMVSIDVDMDAEPDTTLELNQTLLKWSQQFRGGKQLKIVHAWQGDIENLVRHWNTDLNEETLHALSEQLYYQHKKAVTTELQHSVLANKEPQLFMCKGEPAEAIAKVVEEQQTDLLIMGSLARGGIPGLLIGNTAEDLLERVNCSVLTIKPSDFKSPII